MDRPTVQALRDVQARKGDAIVAQNHHQWGDVTISKISWLRVPREGTKLASIILEFDTPQAANLAIREGVLWDSNAYQAVLYDRSIRVRQCFNCQQYGHIGTSCANTMKCVYCAEEHQSRDCSTRVHGENKCANCEGAHPAWSEECEARVTAIERSVALARHRSVYHPVPAPFSMNNPSPSLPPSTLSSWGTPQVSTSSSEEGSASTSAAARSSNGEQTQGTGPTSANRTASGIESTQRAEKAAKSNKSGTKASSARAKKVQQAKVPAERVAEDQVSRVPSPTIEFATTTQEPFIFNTSPPFNSNQSTTNIDFQPPRIVPGTTESINTKVKLAKARTAKAREAMARKRSMQSSQSSQPARKSARFINQLEHANQESELSSSVDTEELERRFNEDQANRNSDIDFQPSSLPDTTRVGPSRKRKQPQSESDISFQPRSSQRTVRKPTTASRQ